VNGFKVFSFRGIPVYFSIWFIVLVAYVAARVTTVGPLSGVLLGLIAAAVILISLIVHEFGHALVARAFRLRPVVLLHGWGGLCAHSSPRSARDDTLIILSGPGAGLIFGVLIWGVTALLDGMMGANWGADLPYLWVFLDDLIMWNIYWSLINLLPIYPLDGGQLFQIFAYKKWAPTEAHKYTHFLGMALAVVGFFYASATRSTLLVVVAILIFIENLQRLQIGPRYDYNERTSGAPVVTQGAGFLGSLKPEPVVARLMIAMGAIWAFFVLAITVFEQSWAVDVYLALRLEPTEAIAGLKVWQLFTYMWLHDISSLGHIVANVFGLWLLGNMFARRWGGKDFFFFMFWSALGAGLFSVIVGHIATGTFGVPIVGYSGAVMALVGALSWTLKDQVLGMFFTVAVKAKYVLPVVVAIDLLMWISGGASDVAVQTHLGGVLSGWLLMTGNWRPKVARERFRLWRVRRGKRKPATKRAPHLKVIDGGKETWGRDDDDEPPKWLH